MTTRLETLKWGGYFSYGEDNFIDFTQNSVTQILGLNGHGKSSIPLILEEVIWNKNSKGIAKSDINNRYLNSPAWAELTFNTDGDSYTLKVERKSTVKVSLLKNGTNISGHTASDTFKTVEKLIQADFKTGSQLIYQSPTSSLNFLTTTDTVRKKFLIDLLKLEEYIERFEVFKEAAKEVSKNVTAIDASISTIENWLKTNSNIDLTIKEKKASPNISVLEDEKEVVSLESSIANILKTNKTRANNSKYKELLGKINITDLQAIPATRIESYDSQQAEQGALESEIRAHTAQEMKLSKLGDVCPTCEQSVEESFKAQLLAAEVAAKKLAQERLDDIKVEIARIKENNRQFEIKSSGIKEWEDLFQAYDPSIESDLLDKEELVLKLEDVRSRIKQAKSDINEIEAYNSAVDKHNSKVSVITEQLEAFKAELSVKSVELEAEKEVLANLEILKKAFSTNGLIAYKIENQVKELEDITNEYLAELSDGRFTLAFNVVSDKLNVDLTDNGISININALSSGELGRVNTATLLGLRKLMNTLSKAKINVLFLDEVISVLDDQGREKLVEILIKEEDLNTYIVSHSWSHPLLAKLEIVKENNISRIESA